MAIDTQQPKPNLTVADVQAGIERRFPTVKPASDPVEAALGWGCAAFVFLAFAFGAFLLAVSWSMLAR